MAEVLGEFPFIEGRRGGTNYAQYCDGRIYRLVAGVDFGATLRLGSVTNALYVAARREGQTMRIVTESDAPLTLVVQARNRT